MGGQRYTHPLIIPDLPADHPKATINTSQHYALQHDPDFANSVNTTIDNSIDNYCCYQFDLLDKEIIDMPSYYGKLPFRDLIDSAIPINSIYAATENMLWQKQLGHPCDAYLYDAHKHIDGVPKFKKVSDVLLNCTTCIQSKQTKTPAGPNTTKKASVPRQGFSINFSFTVMKSKKSGR